MTLKVERLPENVWVIFFSFALSSSSYVQVFSLLYSHGLTCKVAPARCNYDGS